MKIRRKLVRAFACTAVIALLTHEILARLHLEKPMDHHEVVVPSVNPGPSALEINVGEAVNTADAEPAEPILMSPIA